jgi:putative FmdB family regulatory protein
MPIYEYRCEPCDHAFETLVRSSSDVPRCPKCGAIDLRKEFSVPAAAHTGGARGSDLPTMCGPSPMGGACGMGGCGTGMCGMG